MVSINPIVENMSREDVDRYSEKYLLGFTNLSQYGFKIAGLNKARKRFGLEPLNESMVDEYRHNYIMSHFSQDEIYEQMYQYMATHRVAKERYALNGLELLDCAFRRTYVTQFKKLIGADKFKEISERLRVDKMMTTQTDQYGGVGIGGRESLDKALFTKNNKLRAEFKKYFDTKHVSSYLSNCVSTYELEVFDDLTRKFGFDDVIYQYGVHPEDSRYPFDCDFYIKSLDLFIELNYHYSHGRHWFDPTSDKDCIKAESWKNHDNIHYRKAYVSWTEVDVKRREYAKMNNLNYLIFWHIQNKKSDYDIWKKEYNYDFKKFIQDYPNNTY